MGTFVRAVVLGAVILAAAAAASTASAAVSASLACTTIQSVTLTVTGLTPLSSVALQRIVEGVPGDPYQLTADATGTLTTTFVEGLGASPVAVHVVDDTTGLSTTTADLGSCAGKTDCMGAGFAALGFRNQGQCVSFFEPSKKTT